MAAVGILVFAVGYAFWPRGSRPALGGGKDLVGLGLDHLNKRRVEKDIETMKSVLDKLTGLDGGSGPKP
jgi:hypothetical protein